MIGRALAFAAALLPAGGCAWFDQRVADLHDCVLYRWHQEALGFAAEAKIGPLEAALGGWYADWGWGKDTWWQHPGHVLTCHGTGIPFTTLGPIAYGEPLLHAFATSTWGNHPAAPGAFDDVRSWLLVHDLFDLDDGLPFALTPRQRVSDLFGVEVGVVPVFVALRVGVNVAEFVDFALGFVGIDLFADDGRPRPPTLPYVPAGR